MPTLQTASIAPEAVLLRRHGGVTRVFGAPTVTIGTPGVTDAWVQWRWDGERFELKTDRFGLIPVYTAQIGSDFAIALAMDSLLAMGVPSALDEEAVAVQLRFGSYFSESTPFRHIRALPPGAVLTWREGIVSLRSDIRWPKPDTSISRAAALKSYAEIFRDAVARRAARASRIVMPLSAGLDSTHILLALNESGVRPEICVTVANDLIDNTQDVLGATITARHVGAPHRILRQSTQIDDVGRWVAESMGLRVHQHYWAKPLAVFMAEQENACFFDGLAGDNLSASSFLSRNWATLAARGRMLDLADSMLSRHDAEAYWQESAQPSILRRFPHEAARLRIAADLDRHLDCANPVGRFMFMNRMRTLIAPMPTVALRRFAEPLLPFLDDAVFELLASLPVDYLFDKNFHREAIAGAYGAEWPPRVSARASWRARLHRFALWKEYALQTVRGDWRFDRVLRRSQTLLNPLRWTMTDYQYSVVLNALYLQRLLAAEKQPASLDLDSPQAALAPGWV